ncbi:cation:proton antiporter [Candidatus Woesearchaeota archaeon]|nr:cation:proton antiporter [Candidatus Woesearchaeota archaeon]
MQEALLIITTIAVFLFIGVLCSWIGKLLKIPDMLLLILVGLAFGKLEFQGAPLVQIPEVFLASLSILALALVVFDGTARLRLRELDIFSLKATRLTFIFTVFILVLFTITSHYVLAIPWWSSLLFAAIMTGTSSEALMHLNVKSKAVTIAKLESIFNTPITLILPFIVLDLMKNIKTPVISEIITAQLTPFVLNIIIGLGTGVFVGLILFKLVQHAYAEVYSPLAVIVAALLAYVLAENLGGSGVLSVTALGLFFGNVYVKEKITILGIESVLTKILYILVFMLTGVAINMPINKQFLLTSAALFASYLAIRFLAVWASLRKENNLSEILLLTLMTPKGLATAAVVFTLLTRNIEGMAIVLDMTFAFILYSNIITSIGAWVYRRT